MIAMLFALLLFYFIFFFAYPVYRLERNVTVILWYSMSEVLFSSLFAIFHFFAPMPTYLCF